MKNKNQKQFKKIRSISQIDKLDDELFVSKKKPKKMKYRDDFER